MFKAFQKTHCLLGVVRTLRWDVATKAFEIPVGHLNSQNLLTDYATLLVFAKKHNSSIIPLKKETIARIV